MQLVDNLKSFNAFNIRQIGCTFLACIIEDNVSVLLVSKRNVIVKDNFHAPCLSIRNGTTLRTTSHVHNKQGKQSRPLFSHWGILALLSASIKSTITTVKK